MSDTPEGPTWWQAADGKWYPPDSWTGPAGTAPPDNGRFEPGAALRQASTGASTGQGTARQAAPTTADPARPWYLRLPALAGAGLVVLLLGGVLGRCTAGGGASKDVAATSGSSSTSTQAPTSVPATTATTTTTEVTTTEAPTTTTTTTVPTTTTLPPPSPDKVMCVEVASTIDDWFRNLAVAGEVASKITAIRDRYRGQLSPGLQAALDAAKETVGAGNASRMINPDSGLVQLARTCNNTFGFRILTAPAV